MGGGLFSSLPNGDVSFAPVRKPYLPLNTARGGEGRGEPGARLPLFVHHKLLTVPCRPPFSTVPFGNGDISAEGPEFSLTFQFISLYGSQNSLSLRHEGG